VLWEVGYLGRCSFFGYDFYVLVCILLAFILFLDAALHAMHSYTFSSFLFVYITFDIKSYEWKIFHLTSFYYL
jgi:hypothetical protein